MSANGLRSFFYCLKQPEASYWADGKGALCHNCNDTVVKKRSGYLQQKALVCGKQVFKVYA